MRTVTEVHFWLVHWEHECCGDDRKVGDTISVDLSCAGSAEASDEPLSAVAQRDGSMTLVGDVSDLHQSQPAWLVSAGNVSVAWGGKYPGGRIRLVGRVYEERHSEVSAEVTGKITGIRWHKARYEKTKEGHRVIGYEMPMVIYNTNKYPGYPPPEDPKRTAFREAVRSGKVKGPFTFKPVPMDDYVPSGWAFEFIIEVPD
jgi:hypothetical protein